MCNSNMFCVSGIVFVMYYKKNLLCITKKILSNSLCKMTGKTRLYDRNMKVYNIKIIILVNIAKNVLKC